MGWMMDKISLGGVDFVSASYSVRNDLKGLTTLEAGRKMVGLPYERKGSVTVTDNALMEKFKGHHFTVDMFGERTPGCKFTTRRGNTWYFKVDFVSPHR